jgi:RNA polymerase sigma-70 factor (ECF subfamily)
MRVMNDANDKPLDERLSQITTAWTMVFRAHQGSSAGVSQAQQQLLERYSRAAYRYLLGAVRQQDVADELIQEFALRVVRGAFKQADPQRGRFRSLLKTTLCNLVIDHRRKQRRSSVSLAEGLEPAAADDDALAAQEQAFAEIWRAELMTRAWDALAAVERETGQPLYTVLRLRADHPELRSPQMAERLAANLGTEVTSGWVRKRLFLAREKFNDLLLAQVADSLESPTSEALEEELLDLGLLDYCRSAWERRAERNT